MRAFFRDLGLGFRSLRRQPAFAVTAVLTVALGIGAVSAIFSVVNAVLLRPLPYAEADRLGTVVESLAGLPGVRAVLLDDPAAPRSYPSAAIYLDEAVLGRTAEAIVRDATDLTAAVTPWLQADHDGLTGKMLKWPERAEIDTPVQESLIVELYSK